MRLKGAFCGDYGNVVLVGFLVLYEVCEDLHLSPGGFCFWVEGFVGRGFGGWIKVDGAPAHCFELGYPASSFFKGGGNDYEVAVFSLGEG